jgi:hypothetical protein
MKNRFDSQMELGFDRSCGRLPLSSRQKRLHRAGWWFERMRQVVDKAFDWKAAPAPRPEQIWLEVYRSS